MESLFDMRQHDVVPGEGVQGTLFSEDELIIPESVRSMKKAVSAIHAVPTRMEHAQSLNNRRLFDACILIAQVECRGRESEMMKRLKEDRVSPIFEVGIQHLASVAGIPGKNYKRLYAELDQLFEMVLSWNLAGEDGSIEFAMRSHFFSILGYGKGYKKGMVRFAFDASVLALFLEPTIWAKLSLDVMGGLKTSPSYALYQAVWRYCGTQHKVTAPLATHVWVELILGKSRYVTEESDGRKTVQYGDFKRRVLVDAMERVNACAALAYTIKLIEIKSGNRVVKLQFKFTPKTENRQDELALSWSRDVIDTLKRVGYEQGEIDDISQNHSQEEVAAALTRLASAEKRLREQNKGVTSRKAYFEGILRNMGKQDVTDEKIAAEVEAQRAGVEAENRLAKLQGMFVTYQQHRFSDWYADLPESERNALSSDFMDSAELGAGERMLLSKGVSPSSLSAMSLLKKWMTTHRSELLNQALPNPEDKTFENWMAWRLTGGDVLTIS